jgi:hypothetical protein
MSKGYTVRGLDDLVVQLIREYAAVHHVSQAEVITVAICNGLEREFLVNGYPDGWRIPRTRYAAVAGAAGQT